MPKLGQTIPLKDRVAPSVPPLIGSNFDSIPNFFNASIGKSSTSLCSLTISTILK